MFRTDAECREIVSGALQKAIDRFSTSDVPFEWSSTGVLAVEHQRPTTAHGDVHAIVAVLVTDHEGVLAEYVHTLGNMSRP